MSDGNFVLLMYLIALIMKPILSLAFFIWVVDYILNRVTGQKHTYVTADGVHKNTYFTPWTTKVFIISLILWGIPVVAIFAPVFV